MWPVSSRQLLLGERFQQPISEVVWPASWGAVVAAEASGCNVVSEELRASREVIYTYNSPGLRSTPAGSCPRDDRCEIELHPNHSNYLFSSVYLIHYPEGQQTHRYA